MQRILESCRDEILTKNPHNFALFAEGSLEQLRQLQAQIDEYLGREETVHVPASSELWKRKKHFRRRESISLAISPLFALDASS